MTNLKRAILRFLSLVATVPVAQAGKTSRGVGPTVSTEAGPAQPKDDRVRRYFEAAAIEYRPDSPGDPVKIGLIGDTLRNLNYPDHAWEQIAAFQRAEPLSPGQELPRP